MVTRANMTRRTVWGLMGLVSHELGLRTLAGRGWEPKQKAKTPTVPLPHRRGSLPNCPSIPQFYEAPGLWLRQVHTHHWGRDLARWYEPEPGTRQARVVLVVQEVCAD